MEMTNEQRGQVRIVLEKLLDELYISDILRKLYFDGVNLKPAGKQEFTDLVFKKWGLGSEFAEDVLRVWTSERLEKTPSEVLMNRCLSDIVMRNVEQSTKQIADQLLTK